MLERGLLLLRVVERERAGADLGVELVLDLVDRGGAGVRLRPEVARIGRVAAELEAQQAPDDDAAAAIRERVQDPRN